MKTLSVQEIQEIKDKARFNFDDVRTNDYFYHTINNHQDSIYKLTGYDKTKSLQKDQIVLCRHAAFIVESVEYSNHSGVFIDPNDRIETHFTAQISLIDGFKIENFN